MTVLCKKCQKPFRDNFDLKRHLSRKTPCLNTKSVESVESVDPSGNICSFIINGSLNITFNVFNNDSLSQITTSQVIDDIRNVNKMTHIPYVRAGTLCKNFNDRVQSNTCNHNVILPNIRSEITQVFTKEGWMKFSTIEVINELIKTRAGQLLSFKESIEETNDRVFQIEANKQTWKHIEQFHKNGSEHKGENIEDTRRVQTGIKIALLKK